MRQKKCSVTIPSMVTVPSIYIYIYIYINITYSRWTSSLPSCLWPLRIAKQVQHLTTRQPMVEIVDELILANGAELERRDAHNKQLFSALILPTKGVANSFLVRFAGRTDSRQQLDGQAAWKEVTDKYLNSSVQRWRILILKLNGMVIMQNQDPGEPFAEVFQQRDELEKIGESCTKVHFWSHPGGPRQRTRAHQIRRRVRP